MSGALLGNRVMTFVAEMDLPKECLGPKMQALADDRRRMFAYYMSLGNGQNASARLAGYSESSMAYKSQGNYLMQDQNIQAAIYEGTRNRLLTLAPQAVTAAKAILDNPDHPGHVRVIETILDRTGHFAKTEHKVTVEHTVDVAELEALARRLAGEAGIPVERLIGTNDPEDFSKGDGRRPPKVIEGEVIDGQGLSAKA